MGDTVRARVKRGNLELLESIELPEGKEVTVTILDLPGKADAETFDRSAGGWRNTINAEKLIERIYSDRLIATRPKPRL